MICFSTSRISRWSVGFTKPTIDYEIMSDTQQNLRVLPFLHLYFSWDLISWSSFTVCESVFITKTCLYTADPLKPHFYIVNTGFTRAYIILLISAQKLFWTEIWKRSEFYLKIFHFLVVKFSVYLNRLVFVLNVTWTANDQDKHG